MPDHGARERYSLSTNVNTPLFQVYPLQNSDGAGALVNVVPMIYILVVRKSTTLQFLLNQNTFRNGKQGVNTTRVLHEEPGQNKAEIISRFADSAPVGKR